MRGKRWTDEEKELLGSDMLLSELVTALPHRTLVALRSARSIYFPKRRNKRRNIPIVLPKKPPVGIAWHPREIELLKTDKHAKELLPLLHKSRTVWSVSHKRRQLGLPTPRAGRPTLSPAQYPGTDWSRPTNVLKRELGVAWMTAAKLKRMALGTPSVG